MFFLNIAKGFRSGGFNNPAVCTLQQGIGLPCEFVLDPDYLWSYEIGTKQTFANGQFIFDASVYRQQWTDARFAFPDPVFGLVQEYQVGDVEMTGVDLEFTWRPAAIEGLSVQFAGNWNEAEFATVDPALAAATGTTVGDRPPFTPEWNASISGTYEWTLSGEWDGLAYIAYNHIEPQPGLFAAQSVGGTRDLLRARVGARTGRFGAYLFGNNLLGEGDAIYSQTPAGGITVFTQDYPTQIGVELTIDY